jgi:putative addiction module component (TIGR02574 family)
MTRVQEIRQQASVLSISEKTELAADLLESLPPILDDDDEGVAEARRRDEEMDRDPAASITWEQLRRGLGR